MATYSSTNITNKTGVAAGGAGGSVLVAHATVSCAAAPSTSDTLQFFYLPSNARVLLAVLEATDMDTAGPTLTLNIGDGSVADRLFAASTVAQAGTLSSAIATAGAGYKYSSKTMITGTAAANATTGAAGSVTLTVFYVID